MSNRKVVLDIQNQEHVPHFNPTEEDLRTARDKMFISRLWKEIKKSGEESNSSEQIPKIQLIPQFMLDQMKFGKDHCRPRAMTMGPIWECQSWEECEVLKLKLAAKFIRNSGKTSNDLLASIQKEIETLSKCFDNQVLQRFTRLKNNGRDLHNFRFHPLARMLLLDGCSILQFIYSRVWDKLKVLQINNGQASLIEQDLFLMENQIPFRVLEILMDQLPIDGALTRTVLQHSIDIFIRMNLMTPENVLKGSYLDFYKEKHPVHLLDILRSGLLYAFDPTNNGRSSDRRSRDPSSNKELKREYFRNIQELKAAGIKLESSGTSCLGDVTFTSFGWFRARLKIPPLIVNDATGRKLRNLVAYEMCPENCNSDFGVTSYVSLLDSLIDSEEDVKELRSAHILRNHLGSDKEVANLFNEIGYNKVSGTDQAYHQVKQRIQSHFDSWWAISIAQFLQEYFKNPWTFIALLGAIAVLALTVSQTYFTINPPK
ncbi:hypothetical protein UlMin_028013 [Ulmus minor]